MSAPWIQTSFANGEIAPSLFGHVDLAKFHSAAATLRNCYVGYRGGAYSRAGTAFVGRSRQGQDQPKPRLIAFEFSVSQTYILEFGEHYLRFISNGGFVVEGGKAITAASQAVSCQITAPANGFSNGDWVVLVGILGMTQLNGNTFIVASATTNTFTLQDLDGNPIDSTGYDAFVSGVDAIAARLYTISTPYAAADLPLLKLAQSADVISLTHPNYPQQDLARLGPLNWTIGPSVFGAAIAAPTSLTITATVHPSTATTPPTQPCAYAYVVTAVDPIKGEESVASPVGNVTDSVDMAVTAGSEIVEWSPVAGAAFYNIYRAPPSYKTGSTTSDALPVPAGAFFGYVGSSFGTKFIDSNIVADFSHSPPLHKDPFAPGQITAVGMGASSGDWTNATIAITSSTGSGFVGTPVISGGAIVAVIIANQGKNYQAGDAPVFIGDGTSASGTLNIGPQTGTFPGVVSYIQQRRVYADSLNNPDTLWLTQPGAFNNMDSSIPVNDADAITATPWSQRINGVEWMVQTPLGLITFTGSDVWQVGAVGSSVSAPAPLTPTSLVAQPLSSIGSNAIVPPIKIDRDILYLHVHGASVRDLTYQLYFNIFTGVDASWQSSHLLIGHTIVEWAWAEEPYRVVWMARDDGILLSLTYLKEQEVAGFARHDTLGLVRGVCTVTELPVDALYLVVERPVPIGGTRFFIERMNDRIWPTIEDVWAVDCALSLPLPAPNATLQALSATGAVDFVSSPGVFVPEHAGSVIRSGGGVALITSYAGPTQVSGRWLYPCQQVYPNDPDQTPIVQPAGKWSVAGDVSAVKAPHLAGKTVTGLADGIVIPPRMAADDGWVTLDRPASAVVVGLGYAAQIQSVYADTGQPTIQGRRKSVTGVTARIEASATIQAGANQIDSSTQTPTPLFNTWPGLAAVPDRGATYTTASGGTVRLPFTGDLYVNIPSDWQTNGQVAIQQTQPLPLAVLALIPEILPGDIPEVEYSQRRERQRQAP